MELWKNNAFVRCVGFDPPTVRRQAKAEARQAADAVSLPPGRCQSLPVKHPLVPVLLVRFDEPVATSQSSQSHRVDCIVYNDSAVTVIQNPSCRAHRHIDFDSFRRCRRRCRRCSRNRSRNRSRRRCCRRRWLGPSQSFVGVYGGSSGGGGGCR